MHDVEAIAVRPHAMGMPDHDRVRDYIMSRLVALGLKPQLQTTTAVGTRYQEAGRVQNILAWMPGASTTGKAVLLVVHYDGVEAGPAAADDGAGCAALLETLRALRARKEPLAHDVIALFTDGEEAGLLGAAAFVREHPWAKDVAFIMNFEARGTTGRSYMFETGQGNRDAVSATAIGGRRDGRVGVHDHLPRAPQRHRPVRALAARRAGAELRLCRRRAAISLRKRRRRAPRPAEPAASRDSDARRDAQGGQRRAAAAEDERRGVLRPAAARPGRLSDRLRSPACGDRARADGGRRSAATERRRRRRARDDRRVGDFRRDRMDGQAPRPGDVERHVRCGARSGRGGDQPFRLRVGDALVAGRARRRRDGLAARRDRDEHRRSGCELPLHVAAPVRAGRGALRARGRVVARRGGHAASSRRVGLQRSRRSCSASRGRVPRCSRS